MRSKIPLKVLKIDKDGFHISALSKINGKTAHLVVDTGASRTVFDKERIKKYFKKEKIKDLENLSTGLGTNSMQSQQTTLEKFSIGKIEIENYTTILLDLSHVVQSYEMIGLKPVEGVLGSDILKKYNAIIDFKTKTLVLEGKKKKKKVKK
ncbi:MAG: clan AA aspartic protease [Bacteroidia bacterium]|nr:clan AA aspartic protease [Bacteroidia bacterium]